MGIKFSPFYLRFGSPDKVLFILFCIKYTMSNVMNVNLIETTQQLKLRTKDTERSLPNCSPGDTIKPRDLR